MTVSLYSPGAADLPVGGIWVLYAGVVDDDGTAVLTPPTVTVTRPDGTTSSPTVVTTGAGVYRARYIPVAAGRHTARIDAGVNGVADAVVNAGVVVTAAGMPDVDEAKDYLKIDSGDTSRDDDITSALAAETAAQRAMCRVPAVYPDDLREALLRRVARNLAMRGLPLAVLRSDSDAGDTILPGKDPEVRRLEAPHRKRVMG